MLKLPAFYIDTLCEPLRTTCTYCLSELPNTTTYRGSSDFCGTLCKHRPI